MNNSNYYKVNKRYLAEALSFLGQHYMKFNEPDGTVIYCFEKTEEFMTALNGLLELKKQFKN